MKNKVKLIVRVAAEHSDAETFKCLGNKGVVALDDYDYASELPMTVLNLWGDDRFEHGDIMFFNKGILIEIDR
jgi:hypothetical protein